MANKTARAARKKRREKIRLGPSEHVCAFLKLIGIDVQPYPTRYEKSEASDYGTVPRKRDVLQTLLQMKAWHAKVIESPHITKLIYAVCDEQWLAEAKMLRIRADKYKADNPNTVLLPHGFEPWPADPLIKGTHYGKRPPNIYYDAWRNMRQYFSVDFKALEVRVAAHVHDEKLYEVTPHAGLHQEALQSGRVSAAKRQESGRPRSPRNARNSEQRSRGPAWGRDRAEASHGRFRGR